MTFALLSIVALIVLIIVAVEYEYGTCDQTRLTTVMILLLIAVLYLVLR